MSLMGRHTRVLVWLGLFIAVVIPIAAAAVSPLLAWREPIYIVAGFAGVIALSLLLFQPMLAVGHLPGFSLLRSRQAHRWVGGGLVVSVVVHVMGLWITSPPDVIDALLFVSPTPFSVWGVLSMWGVFAAACMAAFRLKLGLRPRTWRFCHKVLAVTIVVGSVLHALQIQGTMETVSKTLLCGLVVLVTLAALFDRRVRK